MGVQQSSGSCDTASGMVSDHWLQLNRKCNNVVVKMYTYIVYRERERNYQNL